MQPLIIIGYSLISFLLVSACEETKLAEKTPSAVVRDTLDVIPPEPLVISNLNQLKQKLNLAPYHARNFHGQFVTIAVLDNGFDGLTDTLGRSLPPDTRVSGSADPAQSQTAHGTHMAEIAYAIATGSPTFRAELPGPTLKLFMTNGPYENLEKAVTELISLKRAYPNSPVIALYSQIWEFGGNGDGRGYINQLVNRAVDAGVLWVNAVGNLGKSTYTTPLVLDERRNVILPFEDYYLKFDVASQVDVRIVLGWNDFTDSYLYRTSQDLDLVLESEAKGFLGAGRLIQDGTDHGNAEGYSRHSREMVRANLAKGSYRLRVTANSDNFTSSSRLWLAVTGEGVKLAQSNGEEMVFAPADNPRVLTVGAVDVAYGNGSHDSNGRRRKPDCYTPSKIDYTNGSRAEGSSTAAAVAAGVLAVLSSTNLSVNKIFLEESFAKGSIGVPASQSGPPGEAPLLRLPAPDTLGPLR